MKDAACILILFLLCILYYFRLNMVLLRAEDCSDLM